LLASLRKRCPKGEKKKREMDGAAGMEGKKEKGVRIYLIFPSPERNIPRAGPKRDKGKRKRGKEENATNTSS